MNDDDEASPGFKRARRMRNFAIAGVLLFLVVLFYIITIVRLGGHVAD